MEKKLTLITGPAGSGKTTKALSFCKNKKHQLIEIKTFRLKDLQPGIEIIRIEGILKSDLERLKSLITLSDLSKIKFIATIQEHVILEGEIDDPRIEIINLKRESPDRYSL